MDSNPSGQATAPPPPPPPYTGPGTDGGPRVDGAQVRDVSRMRRSRDGRSVAGVATGLARHLDVDPTLVKVGFVVGALFGGAGILLYVALWLLVPDEGRAQAIIPTNGELQRVLVIGAAAVAALIVLGQGWGGWWFGPAFPVALLAIVAVALLVGRDRRRNAEAAPQGTPYAAAPPPVPHPGVTDDTAPLWSTPAATDPATAAAPAGGGQHGGPPAPPARPAWAPPPYRPPAYKVPKRTGVVWFWPTLALIAVGLGGLGVYDAGHAVDQAAYPALALAITGVVLVVGAFKGRPGGLGFLGVVIAGVLAISSALGGFHEGTRVTYDPRSTSDVRSSYDLESGELVLNLSNVDDVQALGGRDIAITGGAGVIEVVVPRGVNVEVASRIKVAGGYEIGDRQGGGFGAEHQTTLAGPAGAPTLDLDIALRVGQITVRHPYE